MNINIKGNHDNIRKNIENMNRIVHLNKYIIVLEFVTTLRLNNKMTDKSE